MPIVETVRPGRVEFASSLSRNEIKRLASDPELEVLQCASPVQAKTWDLLNDHLLTLRPDVELRVYGFYSSGCDLSFLPRLKNVRRFAADGLLEATGVEFLSCLKNLEALTLKIYDLDSFDFLGDLPSGMKKLILGRTRSRKPDLEPLGRFRSLEILYLEGQQKNIEVLSELIELRELTLRSISTDGLEYVRPLERLRSLDIKLGGITNLTALEGIESIKYLELWQVKGLSDLSPISRLYGLEHLFLQSLRHVKSLPDLSRLKCLRKIHLENMKGLEDLSALGRSPSLEEFTHGFAQNMQPSHYSDLLKLKTLKGVWVHFGSYKKSLALEAELKKAGIAIVSR